MRAPLLLLLLPWSDRSRTWAYVSPVETPSLLSVNSGCCGELGWGQREADIMSLRVPLPTINSTGGVCCTHYWVIFILKALSHLKTVTFKRAIPKGAELMR